MMTAPTLAELLLIPGSHIDWPSIIQRAIACPHEVKSFRTPTGRGQENCLFFVIRKEAPLNVINVILSACPAAAKEVNSLTGLTALHLAVSRGHDPKIIQRLVQAWPRAIIIPCRLSGGSIPLHSVKNLATAKILVECNPQCLVLTNTAGYLALHRAACALDVPADVVRYLVEMGKKYRNKGGGKLYHWWAFHTGNNLLLGNHGGTLSEAANINGVTPLSAAIDMIVKGPCAVEFLMQKNDGGGSQYQRLSHVAATKWEKLVCIVIAAYEAREERCHQTTPITCFKNGTTHGGGEKTPLLLHAMLSMNLPEILISYAIMIHPEQRFMLDRFGNCALNVAVSNKNVTVGVIRLLSCGDDSIKRQARMLSNDGRLPLHTYISKGRGTNDDVLNLLIMSEPKAIETRDGQTGLYPFALAAVGQSGNLDVTYSLLREAPWLVSRVEENGNTQQLQQLQNLRKSSYCGCEHLWRYCRIERKDLSQLVVQWIVPTILSFFVAYHLLQKSGSILL